MSAAVVNPSWGFSGVGLVIRTPSSTRWPSCRLNAEMIGSRRCRSISFWTKLVGTDNRANPSVITSGLTSFNQALCCGVSVGVAGSPLSGPPVRVSPLSSASTIFQTATNGGSGSAVNDGNPLRLVQGTTKRTKTNCPHSYPQAVDKDSCRRSVIYRRGRRVPGLVPLVPHSVGSRPFGLPRFVVCRRSDGGTALAEANSFQPWCQPFCNIA